MASITIRKLDENVKTRVHAAEHHRSMEEGERLILREAVGRKLSSWNLPSIIRSHFRLSNVVSELICKAPILPSKCRPLAILWKTCSSRREALVSDIEAMLARRSRIACCRSTSPLCAVRLVGPSRRRTARSRQAVATRNVRDFADASIDVIDPRAGA